MLRQAAPSASESAASQRVAAGARPGLRTTLLSCSLLCRPSASRPDEVKASGNGNYREKLFFIMRLSIEGGMSPILRGATNESSRTR